MAVHRFASAAHGSYPRPDHVRPGPWWSLDGDWDFIVDAEHRVDTLPAQADQQIRVPFCWESEASMVHRTWVECAWYRRRLLLDRPDDGLRVVLHFGAVHHAATVYANGTEVARHVGGQERFAVDLTDVAGGEVDLVVRVEAPNDQHTVPHGKQRNLPPDPYDVCSFTPCSGIWQSVWLEHRPAIYLTRVDLSPQPQLDGFAVTAHVSAPTDRHRVRVRLGDEPWTELGPDGTGTMTVREPQRWSPANPFLYAVQVELLHDGSAIDHLVCTAGLRRVEVVGEHLQLNGERIFLRGVLDQGYWPGSGWTAPDEASLIADLEHARACGFTLVRKHLKLEDPRWLHHADRLGMLVWAEPPGPSTFHPAGRRAFEDLVATMIRRDRNHPSVVVWGLYNEEWGLDWAVADDPARQEALRQAYDLARSLDPTRPIVDNSGWSHVATDLTDWHIYSHDLPTWKRQLAEIEAGGTEGFTVDLGVTGEVRKWTMADRSSTEGTAGLNSEYGTGHTSVERAWAMRWQTQELRRLDDLNGYVYTELYDIEHETAGVLSDHRRAKDTLNLVSADSHADTVIVADVVPRRPGLDLVAGPDGSISVDLRVSHHGSVAATGVLQTAWAPALSAFPGEQCALEASTDSTACEARASGHLSGRGQRVTAEPFRLTEPITWSGVLPTGVSQSRLLIWLVSEGAVIARSVLDIGAAASSGPDRTPALE